MKINCNCSTTKLLFALLIEWILIKYLNFQPDKKGWIAHKPKTHLFANVFPHLPVELNFPSLLLPYLQLFPHFEIYIQKSQTKRFFSHSVAFLCLVVTQFEVRAFYTGWKCQLFLSLQIDQSTKFPIILVKLMWMNLWTNEGKVANVDR